MFPLIILFILVILISFFLALNSMRIFEMKPNSKFEHGLFLIRNPGYLTPEVLSSIFADLSKMDLLISFERLFKGLESALVVFGPKVVLLKHQEALNLLELEDYTNLDVANISIWEVGVKSLKDFKNHIPQLMDDEKVWLQLVLKMEDEKSGLTSVQARITVYSPDVPRLKQLTENLQKSYENILPKIPKPYSKLQLFEFYKTRSFIKESGKNIKLRTKDVLNLGFFL